MSPSIAQYTESVTDGVGESLMRYPTDLREPMANALEWSLRDIYNEVVSASRLYGPSRQKIWRVLNAYLDACLRRPMIDVLSAALRGHARAAAIQAEFDRRYIKLIEMALEEVEIGSAASHARIFSALARETRQAERAVNHKMPDFRVFLRRHVRHL